MNDDTDIRGDIFHHINNNQHNIVAKIEAKWTQNVSKFTKTR